MHGNVAESQLGRSWVWSGSGRMSLGLSGETCWPVADASDTALLWRIASSEKAQAEWVAVYCGGGGALLH